VTSIREIDVDRDAPALTALVREINPSAVVDVASMIHRLRSVPDRAEAKGWVAVLDDDVAGRVEVWRNFFTEGSRSIFVDVSVFPRYRGRGIGSALWERGASYAAELGGGTLLTSFHENDAGVAFATKIGFSPARAETEAVLDPRDVTEEPDSNVELVPVRDADPRLVWRVDLEATLDMPQTERVDTIPYDEWVRHVLEHPLFRGDGSFVAMVDGVAAACSLITADLESRRSHNMFTGTLRAYRGRGLAHPVKLGSIQWARHHGITSMATHNDESNAAMLAVNRRLGYRPAGRRVEWVRNPFNLRAGTASSRARRAPAT
jgi:GNAT superfamily N-acetyltransferase